jgi:Kef-type K+ transport system membrane component KefB
MIQQFETKKVIAGYLMTIVLLVGLAIWLKSLVRFNGWEQAGWINFSLGMVMLAAYILARLLVKLQLPLISGYIFAGVLAGPYVSGFLSVEMVERFRLIDDLALSFIALTAGGTLHMKAFQERGKAIALNILLITAAVFASVLLFIIFPGRFFVFTHQLTYVQLVAFAVLMGVIAIARSPSSAIAIISECRAKGLFTETVLGVTIVMDVLIIIFFTIALFISQLLLTSGGMMDFHAIMGLTLVILISMLLGAILGFCISWYIRRVGHDLSLFLLVIAFAVTKMSLWLGHFMEVRFDVSLHLEPLLICMSAGFTVRNFSKVSNAFMVSLEQSALPIYVLFFSLAGASLNFEALGKCWMFAVCLALVRAIGIWGGTWFAGMIQKDPKINRQSAWMAYLTQAGVAIGLAQLVQRQAPEIGVYLTTVVLAVISINQIIGPITFKLALYRVGEATVDQQ